MNEEINNMYLGQGLLDAAMAARAEYERLSAEARSHMDKRECEHPPLTKKGKHDKRIFCNDCWSLYDKSSHKAMILHGRWNGAWDVLAELKGESN